MTKKSTSHGGAIALGAGIAGAAAAAAGAYWLYGAKHAARHRKLAASWMLKARAEVMDALEKVEDLDKSQYLKIVDQTIKKYALHGTRAHMTKMKKDMHGAWKHIQASIKPKKKSAKRRR